jgi:serine/threonine protein kinase
VTEEKERAEAGLTAVGPEAYAVIEVFAEGGIGRILRAHDRRLDRPVALKELLTASRSLEERFVREARLTARLQHPGVVPIYEVGRWPSGEPFYAMRLVAGGPLLDRIAAAPSLDQRLALLPHVITVAEAMAYAHSQRIIHRDLKPENVLVGEYGETVVIDWGLAKDLAEETAEAPVERAAGRAPSATSSSSSGRRRVGRESLTVMGAVMGTLAYMPPEQAYGDPVDERADVYAIGAILYHVIAGGAALPGRDGGGAAGEGDDGGARADRGATAGYAAGSGDDPPQGDGGAGRRSIPDREGVGGRSAALPGGAAGRGAPLFAP